MDTDYKLAANWVINELMGKLNQHKLTIDKSPVSPENLARLLSMLKKDLITRNEAKDILNKMFDTGKSPAEIIVLDLLEEKFKEVG